MYDRKASRSGDPVPAGEVPLFRLQEENLLTPEESEKARQALCKKYKPFTYSLEVDEPWMNGK